MACEGDNESVHGRGPIDNALQCGGGVRKAGSDLNAVTDDGVGLERSADGRGDHGAVADDRTRCDRDLRRPGRRGSRLVEDRPEARVGSAVTGLSLLGLHEGTRNDRLQDPFDGCRPVGADHFEQAGPVDDCHFRATGEQHLARAPGEIVTDEVSAEGTEVLGSRNRAEGEPPSSAGSPRRAGPLQCRGDHAGVGDGRHGVDRHTRWGLSTDLPGERRDGPLGGAVPPGIGGAPSRSGRDAEDVTVTRGGHERQRRVEHVEVAPEMHVEQCEPILLGALREVGLPRDPGHVDDGVEALVLVRQFSEQVVQCSTVGDRRRGGTSRSAGGHDATRRRLFGRGKRFRPVEGYEGIHSDDKPPIPTQLLGDGRTDAASAAGHDAHLLTGAHGAVARTSSSKPSS